jgi:hypothetical protein
MAIFKSSVVCVFLYCYHQVHRDDLIILYMFFLTELQYGTLYMKNYTDFCWNWILDRAGTSGYQSEKCLEQKFLTEADTLHTQYAFHKQMRTNASKLQHRFAET